MAKTTFHCSLILNNFGQIYHTSKCLHQFKNAPQLNMLKSIQLRLAVWHDLLDAPFWGGSVQSTVWCREKRMVEHNNCRVICGKLRPQVLYPWVQLTGNKPGDGPGFILLPGDPLCNTVHQQSSHIGIRGKKSGILHWIVKYTPLINV